jgi:hypothetical protein
VIAAKVFSLLVPVGGAAFRVNLFSLFCASLSVAGVQLLARRSGAARWASSLGALCLAVGAGYWFYAGFAKHDMFSGLILLIALYLLLEWEAHPTTWKLVGVGAAVAIDLGSSWPLMVLLLPTIAFVLVRARHQIRLRSLASATATGLVVLVALGAFVIVRANQNPGVNFDRPTTIGRLAELVTRSDYLPHANSVPTGGRARAAPPAGASGGQTPPAGVVSSRNLTTKVNAYVTIFARELGIVALILAAWGLVVSLVCRRSRASYPLLITFLANLLGAAVVVGLTGPTGYNADLIEEGFLLGCYFVLACWLALGATDVVSRASSVRALDRIGGRGRAIVSGTGAVILGAAVLIPPAIAAWPVAHRASKPFADRYATTVFGELPHGAAVIVSGQDLTYPLVYRQLVQHERRDVVVIDLDASAYPWYREELSRRLGLRLPPSTNDSILDARGLAKWLSGMRPVYFDPHAAQVLAGVDPYAAKVAGNRIGYRQVGLLAQFTSGVGPATVANPSVLDQAFRNAERAAGMPDSTWNDWPNDLVLQAVYSTAALEVARAYFGQHDIPGVRSALLNALRIQPDNPAALTDLAKFGA